MSNKDNVTLNDLPTGWIYTTLDIIRVNWKILVGWVEVTKPNITLQVQPNLPQTDYFPSHYP